MQVDDNRIVQRVDFYYDHSAPPAEQLVPSVTVLATNQDQEILLIRRSDSGYWSLPGGAVDIGERVADAAVREVIEETGIEVALVGLIGIYSDPGHVLRYSEGNTRQEFSICFRALKIGGTLEPQVSETLDAAWFDLPTIFRLPIHGSMRIRISDAYSGKTGPFIR